MLNQINLKNHNDKLIIPTKANTTNTYKNNNQMEKSGVSSCQILVTEEEEVHNGADSILQSFKQLENTLKANDPQFNQLIKEKKSKANNDSNSEEEFHGNGKNADNILSENALLLNETIKKMEEEQNGLEIDKDFNSNYDTENLLRNNLGEQQNLNGYESNMTFQNKLDSRKFFVLIKN